MCLQNCWKPTRQIEGVPLYHSTIVLLPRVQKALKLGKRKNCSFCLWKEAIFLSSKISDQHAPNKPEPASQSSFAFHLHSDHWHSFPRKRSSLVSWLFYNLWRYILVDLDMFLSVTLCFQGISDGIIEGESAICPGRPCWRGKKEVMLEPISQIKNWREFCAIEHKHQLWDLTQQRTKNVEGQKQVKSQSLVLHRSWGCVGPGDTSEMAKCERGSVQKAELEETNVPCLVSPQLEEPSLGIVQILKVL